ncbi:MAG: hypothetical protein Hyperionvirus10_22 [Hyperionvirus sp.]|uniref:Uncharacterized protein n=1 Tax=Hyperionvirus sp. TaxID=2487770 RepID=A0A3G5A8T8_9VIRU|nr:MAG: hypothetical protein Hyperionvirus10_22 [Hyperionvirus sp.]
MRSAEEKKTRLENKYQINLDRLQKENIDYDVIGDVNVFYNEKIVRLKSRASTDGGYISRGTTKEYLKAINYYQKKMRDQEAAKGQDTRARDKLIRELGKLSKAISVKILF